MAVSLSTDIVADVMRAATPERVQEARTRLRSLAGTQGTAEGKQAEAYKKFDAMVLGTFVESMLPKEAESVFGDGLAGDMWKSMLAQQLGDSIAAQGGIGIASRYIGDSYADGDLSSPLRGAADPSVRAAMDGRTSLSRSLVEELQRKALDGISGAAIRPAE